MSSKSSNDIKQKFYLTSSRAIFLLLDIQQIFTLSSGRLVGSYFSATRHLVENPLLDVQQSRRFWPMFVIVSWFALGEQYVQNLLTKYKSTSAPPCTNTSSSNDHANVHVIVMQCCCLLYYVLATINRNQSYYYYLLHKVDLNLPPHHNAIMIEPILE